MESLLSRLLKQFAVIVIALWSVVSHAYWDGDNLLIGISGGYARHTGKLDIGVVYPIPKLTADSFANGHGDIWNKGIFIGYRHICNNWLLDGELHLDLYDVEPDFFFSFNALFSDIIYHGKRRYKHGPGFGITGRWGYVVSPYVLPYIVLGLESNKDKLEITVQGNTPFFTEPVVLYDSRQQYRGIAGFGAEFPLCFFRPNLSLRLEYRYYSLDKVLNPRGTLSSPLNLDPALSFALRPKFNTFRLQLLWNFL